MVSSFPGKDFSAENKCEECYLPKGSAFIVVLKDVVQDRQSWIPLSLVALETKEQDPWLPVVMNLRPTGSRVELFPLSLHLE